MSDVFFHSIFRSANKNDDEQLAVGYVRRVPEHWANTKWEWLNDMRVAWSEGSSLLSKYWNPTMVLIMHNQGQSIAALSSNSIIATRTLGRIPAAKHNFFHH